MPDLCFYAHTVSALPGDTGILVYCVCVVPAVDENIYLNYTSTTRTSLHTHSHTQQHGNINITPNTARHPLPLPTRHKPRFCLRAGTMAPQQHVRR